MLDSAAPLRPLLLSILIAASGGCAAPDSASEPSSPDAKGSKEKQREQELAEARLQLELAEFVAGDEGRQARASLEKARRELDEAHLAQARFREHQRPLQLSEARLSLDRAAQNASEAEQELAQMEEMYQAEPNLDPTGVRTRDMVLERHRKRLEFAKRTLEQQQQKLSDLESRELPREERELESKRVAAEVSLADAEAKLHKAEVDGRLSLMKARAKVEKLERGEKGEGEKSDEGDES